MSGNRWNFISELIQSYGVLTISILVGVAISLFKPEWLTTLEPIGKIYFNLLKMWALPIMMVSVVLAIAKFLRKGNLRAVFNSLVSLNLGAVVIVFITVTLTSIIFSNGSNLSTANLNSLGRLINASETSLEMDLKVVDEITKTHNSQLLEFIANMVPENIFSALSQGAALQVVIFSICFGLVLGLAKSLKKAMLPKILEEIYASMNQVTTWVGLFVPLGLCIQVAIIAKELTLNEFLAMRSFIFLIGFLYLIICSFSIFIICRRSRFNLSFVITALGEPSLLVLSAQDGIPAIPASIATLHNTLQFDRETVDLVLPLSVILIRVGSFIYLIAVIFFVAGLYHIPMDINDLLVMLAGVGLCSMATSTTTGADDLLILVLPVTNALDLPVDGIMIPLMAIDLILQPVRELTTIYASMAITAILATSERIDRYLKLPF